MTSTAGSAHPDRSELTHMIDSATREALDAVLDELGPSNGLDPLVETARSATSGGKRLRGRLALVGAAIAAGTQPGDAGPDALAAALELYQASALAHDDLIDHSDTRRGRPTPHVSLATVHRATGWRGSPTEFGTSAAILLGDLLLSAADRTVAGLARDLGTTRGAAVLARFTLMHAEVALGQYLDVAAEQSPLDVDDDGAVPLEPALEVVRRKSARYSVVHPLALGVIAGGGDADLVDAVERVVGPWGVAFQLRDDDLGVFGDPADTGKPTGSDLLEGKRTPLLALTWAHATRAERAVLAAGVGRADTSPEQLTEMVEVVRRLGRGPHETFIEDLVAQGGEELARADLDDGARHLLVGIGEQVSRRQS